ncbi:MAG TPA: glycine-rich protein, partial [Bacteroidia bacterium]
MKRIYTYITALFAAAAIQATAQTTVNFNYTGSVQTFTVPACVTSVTIDARGASGAANGPTAGGMGGRVQGTLSVNPGDVIYIYVGQTGINSLNAPTGVYNGGGGVYSYASCGTAGTGGGASDIRLNGTAYTNVVLVAGGGGGAGGYVAGNQTYAGGNGGGLIGVDGVPWPGWPNSGGKGGTQAAGGAAGTACCSCPTYTTSGAQGQGGNGSGDCAGGGGGGGGWYGGGGSCFGGGGGGSSYTSGVVTSVIHTQGFQTGDGFVSITYTPGTPSAPSSISGPVTVCSGSTNTYSISPVPGATSYTWTLPGGWTGTSTTTSISATAGAGGGNITVTANNSCGSSSPQSLSVTVNVVTASTMVTNVTCNGNCNGSAMAMATGNGPFTYSWAPGGMTTQTINNLCAGSYTAFVTGAGGCSSTASATISQPSALTLGGTQLNASCNGACDGSISPVATGGTSPYTYSGSMSNLCAGNYTVTVTDANNCTAINIFNITQPGQVIVALNSGGSICNGTCTTLIATAAGGNGGPFTYMWMPGNLTGAMPNVCPTTTTTYTCTASDVSGCTGSSTTTVTVFPLPGVTYSQSPA